MRPRHAPPAALPALLAALVISAPGHSAAQTTNTGGLAGTVRAADTPVSRAVVTLSPVGNGLSLEASSGTLGDFAFNFVAPGSYELRVEAVGYQPLLVRVVTIAPGDRVTLSLSLNVAQPPVIAVDTLLLGSTAATRVVNGGFRLGSAELHDLPNRTRSLSWIAGLAGGFDGSMGAEGLPGSTTLLVADGVPVYRAPHPTAAADRLQPLFSTTALSGLSAYETPPDIEWSGSTGGYVATSTAGGLGPFAAEVAYSGDIGWQSGQLDIVTPSLLSLEAVLGGDVTISPDASHLTLSADVLRHQTPLAPRATEAVASSLGGLDPDVLTRIVDPTVETYARYSGLARLDVQSSRTSSLFFRGAASYSMREFDGPGAPDLAGAAAPTDESIDFSIAGGYVGQRSPRLTLELRGGVSGSYRDFGSTDGVPAAYLVDSGSALGGTPAETGTSSRTDILFTPSVMLVLGNGSLKVGAPLRVSRHAMEHSPATAQDLAYADPAALLAGRGYGLASTAADASFSTQEGGLFVQYDGVLGAGVRYAAGARYDYERISLDALRVNEDWLLATGLDNSDVPDGFGQLGARGSLEWDPTGTGSTKVLIAASLRSGDLDPRAVYQLLSEDVGATTERFTGTGVSWPDGGVTGAGAPDLPTLTLLGPDTRPPKTVGYSLTLTQRIGSGVSLHVRGATRRTDFLMRRRNLNLPVVPLAVDAYGRDVFGSLAQDGGLVTATADDARRFAAFGDVWALDPDGFSEYKGFGAGLDYSGPSVDLFGTYTYSETTDNWVGAASGLPDATLVPSLPAPAGGGAPWSEGVSDFDVPHRATAGLVLHAGLVELAGRYGFRSGLPFTPRYRYGVDANGDGSLRNDVAFVPGDAQLAPLLDDWPCLEDQADGFAARNSCRGPSRHSLDLRLSFVLGAVSGMDATVTVDALDLIESSTGVLDDALLLVDPAGSITTSPDGTTVTVPVGVNPDFGSLIYPDSRGRMFRIAVRIGR